MPIYLFKGTRHGQNGTSSISMWLSNVMCISCTESITSKINMLADHYQTDTIYCVYGKLPDIP